MHTDRHTMLVYHIRHKQEHIICIFCPCTCYRLPYNILFSSNVWIICILPKKTVRIKCGAGIVIVWHAAPIFWTSRLRFLSVGIRHLQLYTDESDRRNHPAHPLSPDPTHLTLTLTLTHQHHSSLRSCHLNLRPSWPLAHPAPNHLTE